MNHRFAKRNVQGGFTFVELLIVLFVVAILLGVAYPHIGSMNRKSRAVECEGNLQMIEAAKAAYVADNMGQVPIALNFSSADPAQRSQAENAKLVLLSYFPEGLKARSGSAEPGVFTCPKDPDHEVYSNVFNFYANASCPYCTAHPN